MPVLGPDLSVVVAVVSGKEEDLERCLTALHAQVGAPPREIIVPLDPPCAALAALEARFPDVRFVLIEGEDTLAARSGAGHKHLDRLRTAGLLAARGEYVVLTEDHARADPNLCGALLDVLLEHRNAGCAGGAIEFGGASALAFLIYLCDFSRYQNPLLAAEATYVSDTCVVYRRSALDAVQESWNDCYHETVVHDALRRAGFRLRRTPHAISYQDRRGLNLFTALRERFVWGASYAATRVRGAPPARRLGFALATPLLPFLLTWRIVRGAVRRQRDVAATLAAVPPLLLLQTFWSLGELVGYLTGRAR